MNKAIILAKVCIFILICSNSVFAQSVVSIQIQEQTGNSHTNEHITFGHVFKQGDVATTSSLVASSGGGTLPLQVNKKSTHADGSLRHAILSLKLDNINANELVDINLEAGQSPLPGSNLQLADLMSSEFTSSVDFVLEGVNYTASLTDGIAEGNVQNWLEGPLAAEWLVRASVKNAQGVVHPHLTVRFNVRTYAGFAKTKLDVIVENSWSYVASPKDFTYNLTVNVEGQSVYNKAGLEHFSQARWKKTFWNNGGTGLDVIFDKNYLMQTRAFPNYDLSLQIPETTLSSVESEINASNTEPMGVSVINPYMLGGGGRPEIGPLHKWSSLYLLSMDKRAKDGMMKIGTSGGSWSIHYRDQNTDLPISVLDYPYASVLAGGFSTTNPNTGRNEAFPRCDDGDCNSPYSHDTAHQPSFAYTPYLITGDHFYLEELMFWSSFNILWNHPVDRNHEEGLIKANQVRGQAWMLRTIGQAAYITPDGHPLKSYYVDVINNNLAYYNNRYLVDSTTFNPLGFVTESYAINHAEKRGNPSWMDDFFTWSIGYLKALGFQDASPLLEWKVTSAVERMTNADYCWILGSPYSLIVRDGSDYPLYTTFAEVYNETVNVKHPEVTGLECGSQSMADALGLSLGEMYGYAGSTVGYPANLQIALAIATETSYPNAALAWQVFEGRSVKPNYADSPQFAIVPFVSEIATTPVEDITAPTVTNLDITITGNIPNATALTSGSATGVVQANGDFTITVTVPDGTTLVTLTATLENQTSTIDVNIDADFSTSITNP